MGEADWAWAWACAWDGWRWAAAEELWLLVLPSGVVVLERSPGILDMKIHVPGRLISPPVAGPSSPATASWAAGRDGLQSAL